MESLEELYDDASDYPQNIVFHPHQRTAALPGNPRSDGGWPPISSASSAGYHLIHHLFHPAGAPRRGRGQLRLTAHNPNLGFHPFSTERDEEEGDGQAEGGTEESEAGGRSAEEGVFGTKKRSAAALVAEWSDDICRVKRMKGQRGGGKEWRRKEREELKEQLEEARERLQALQEKVWRVFGEQRMVEEERKPGQGKEKRGGGATEEESLCLLPAPPLHSPQGAAKRREGDACEEEGGEWDEGLDSGEEGGEGFARALKLELGSTVARVIDRVLRLYAHAAEGGEEAGRGGGPQEDSDLRERQRPEAASGSPAPPGEPRGEGQPAQQVAAAIPRPHDDNGDSERKGAALLQPRLAHSHHGLVLRHASLPRPPLLPPPTQSKALSSSFPPPPPPPHALPTSLPLPILHYSMQQLFARSLQEPPHSHPFLELQPHLSSHAAPFLPLPLLGHLEHSLGPHPCGADRERDRGLRGDGGLDGGELYLPPGGTQEGLSPCHLKKAKLMFFYARYPSSNTLKTFFPDVKFNRCVTSQLIKWFSNFREFFYIQMERFARQAVREALTRDVASCLGRESQLHMGRDTELYRILNLHYNKSNVYQVPEKFIDVSEVALREFYSAIRTGRDNDPCWKKGIYKIVCKLDSPVPDAFRLPGCPVG